MTYDLFYTNGFTRSVRLLMHQVVIFNMKTAVQLT